MILLTTLLFILLLRTESKRQGCSFPQEWEGIWFQSTVRPYTTIDSHTISSKGECIRADIRGEKFIIKEKPNCYKCIVIYQKHQNVLQYKETFRCSNSNNLHRVCGGIAGDANLYTLFRVDGQPIKCPFGTTQSFKFSYNRGKGDCKWPESELVPCTDNKRFTLHYQACPNVQGSELMSQKLECQASWRDGSRHFMVGKLDYPHATTDEDKFRCFVYEYKDPLTPSKGLFLAQSGDATCNGLFSPHEGSRTLNLKAAPSKIGCTFPAWMQSKKAWSSIDSAFVWKFSGGSTAGNSTWRNNTKLATSENNFVNHEESQVWCHKIQELSVEENDSDRRRGNHQKIILYATSGCTSGYICADIRQLNPTVLRVKLGMLTRTVEYACDASQFSDDQSYLLVTSGRESLTDEASDEELTKGLYHVEGESTGLVRNPVPQGGQLSAAVRGAPVDFLNEAKVGMTSSTLCQDGKTSKVISVIVGCKADLEMRSSCSSTSEQNHVDFPKEYETTQMWSENGTIFRVYKPLQHGSKDTSLCLGFVPQPTEDLKRPKILVDNLDQNCQINRQKRKEVISSTQTLLLYEGGCSSVSSSHSLLAQFGFQQQLKGHVFMVLLNLSLFHYSVF